MKSMKFTGPLQYQKTYLPWEERAKKELGKAFSEMQSLILRIEYAKTDPDELATQLNNISRRVSAAARAVAEDRLEEGDHLRTLDPRDKLRIVQEWEYFRAYILSQMLRRSKDLAELLWGLALQDPDAAEEVRSHATKLRLNGKLRGKKK